MKRLFLIGVILSMIAVSLTAMDDNLLVAKKGEAANHIPDKAKESAGIPDDDPCAPPCSPSEVVCAPPCTEEPEETLPPISKD